MTSFAMSGVLWMRLQQRDTAANTLFGVISLITNWM
jgi:hypothetical protein